MLPAADPVSVQAAAALLLHYRRRDLSAFVTCIAELKGETRLRETLVALVQLSEFNPALLEDLALAAALRAT